MFNKTHNTAGKSSNKDLKKKTKSPSDSPSRYSKKDNSPRSSKVSGGKNVSRKLSSLKNNSISPRPSKIKIKVDEDKKVVTKIVHDGDADLSADHANYGNTGRITISSDQFQTLEQSKTNT